MLFLMDLVLVLVSPALLTPLLVLPLLAAAVESLDLLLILRSVSGLILRLLLLLCGVAGRAFASMGYVLRPPSRGVSQTIRRFGLPGKLTLGFRSPEVRSPSSFPCPPISFSGSDSSSQLFSQLHQGDCVGWCDCGAPRERSSRASSVRSGILQSPLCHPQGHRGLEVCNRPLMLQPFGPGLQVSHGDCRFSSPISSSKGLDGVPGSPGRLPSGTGASVISPLPEVLRGGIGPAVSRPLLRSVDCTAGVHTGHGPCVCHHAPLRAPHPSLSGQLARPRLLVSGCSAAERLSPLAFPRAQSLGEPLQELSESVSDFGLSGDETSNTSFEGSPDPKACPETLLSAARIRVLSSAAARAVAPASRCNVVPIFHCSGVAAADVLSPTLPQHYRSSLSGFRLSYLGRFLPRGSSVVVRRIPSVCGSSAGSSGARSGPVHQRLGYRLGRIPSGRPSVRLVVSVLFDLFDQPQGASGSALQCPEFPSNSLGSLHVPLCGQYHCFVLLT